MRKSFILAALGGAILATSVAPAAAQQPPWCSEQSRKVDAEWTICQTRALWELEAELNGVYGVARAQLPASHQAILVSSQGNWLRETRDPCGSDVGCLRSAYRVRINTLNDIASRGHF